MCLPARLPRLHGLLSRFRVGSRPPAGSLDPVARDWVAPTVADPGL